MVDRLEREEDRGVLVLRDWDMMLHRGNCKNTQLLAFGRTRLEGSLYECEQCSGVIHTTRGIHICTRLGCPRSTLHCPTWIVDM